MKLKAAVLYRYDRYVKVIAVFAALLLIPIIGALIATKLNNYQIFGKGSFYLFPICCILSLIIGITSYKPVLKFFLQNGVSRQSTHLSFILSLPVGIILALVECLIHVIVCAISDSAVYPKNPAFKEYFDVFSTAFNYGGGVLKIMLMRLLIGSLAFMMLISFGYLLSSIFSGMKPFYKIIVTVVLVVLAVFSIVLSSVADSYAYLGMPTWLAFIAYFVFGGLGSYYIDHYITAMIVFTVLFTSISHLLVRKAVIRK